MKTLQDEKQSDKMRMLLEEEDDYDSNYIYQQEQFAD